MGRTEIDKAQFARLGVDPGSHPIIGAAEKLRETFVSRRLLIHIAPLA